MALVTRAVDTSKTMMAKATAQIVGKNLDNQQTSDFAF